MLFVCTLPARVVGQDSRGGLPALVSGGAEQTQRLDLEDLNGESSGVIPPDFVPWWQAAATTPMGGKPRSVSVDVEDLVLRALRCSTQVRVLSDVPLIHETGIEEARAKFDARAFVDSEFLDTSEPVGSLLTTGGPLRFRDHDWRFVAGYRKLVPAGGEFELSQRFGVQANNSRFFVPPEQGTARLSLSFTQPLLKGRGRTYNTATIVLAEIKAAAAMDEFSRQLQQHLLEVHHAYWRLYLERAALVQRERLYEQGRKVQAELESRREIDALTNQIMRARARVATRHIGIINSRRVIRNTEAQIRALVNDPEFEVPDPAELVPSETATRGKVPVDLSDALATAAENRPEVHEAMKQVQATAVRAGVAKSDLLPALSLVLETYVSGLEGDSRVDTAWMSQFTKGEPSYTIGLFFEVPVGNGAARARYRRNQLEMRQSSSQLQAALENVKLEVDLAVRDVKTFYREIQTWYLAMQAAAAELDYVHERWRLFPGEELVLEDLLESQERLAEAEFNFARALVSYSLALVELRRAKGTLLSIDEVVQGRSWENGLPGLILGKPVQGKVLPELPPMEPAYPPPDARRVPSSGGRPELGGRASSEGTTQQGTTTVWIRSHGRP